jgi:ABC-type transporter Mla subunit MlaD
MRRLLGIAAVLVAAVALVVVGTAAGGGSSDGSYEVRAIFRNAFSVIPGEDVKVAGVRVGRIKSLDVTPQQTAAVVLDITNKGFQDFRADAECTIRPQSLIGEKFVECTPTQPRGAGRAEAPPLERITHGDGKGQYLLPVDRTRRPVDIDLVANTLRLPYRERLTILLNEFGTAVAGRGEDLRKVIRNADPALAQTDRVLQILGDQNKVLADLARDSDAVLAPLAEQRRHVAGFVSHAGAVAQATAEKQADLERNLQKLPEFLRQLTPTMQRLGTLSEQGAPVLRDLGAQATSINRLVRQMGPFARSATPALETLGEASVPGRKALVKAKPIVRDLRDFGSEVQPLSQNLRALLTSVRDTGGIERALDYIFYQAAAVNGFDAYGHYLRAQLVVNLCSVYATKPDPACSAKFSNTGSSRSARAALASKDEGRTPALAREDALLRGLSLTDILGGRAEDERQASRPGKGRRAPALSLPQQLLPGAATPAPAQSAPGGDQTVTTGPKTPAAPSTPPSQPGQNAVGALLDYLLGGP